MPLTTGTSGAQPRHAGVPIVAEQRVEAEDMSQPEIAGRHRQSVEGTSLQVRVTLGEGTEPLSASW